MQQPPGRERPPSSSRPQITMVEIQDDAGDETNASAALVSPLENDDIVADSLRILPALPSSLIRASFVCKQWSRVVSNPRFLREFRAFHQKPPLVGLFSCDRGRIIFTPMLKPPDRIPASRFSLEVAAGATIACCHHGRVLIQNELEKHFLVWHPVTRELCRVSMPPPFHRHLMKLVDAVVFCASTEQGHIHGTCHSEPFQVVVVASDMAQFYACVYSSETRAWGNFSSIMKLPHMMMFRGACRSTLFRNSISLFLYGENVASILEFNRARQTLDIINAPRPQHLNLNDFIHDKCQFMIKPSDGGGGLSLIVINLFTVNVWERTSVGEEGVAIWLLGNTFQLNILLSLGPLPADPRVRILILGLDDDGNVLLKMIDSGVVFMVHLEAGKFEELAERYPYVSGHPFSTFYAPGMRNNTGHGNEVQNIPGA